MVSRKTTLLLMVSLLLCFLAASACSSATSGGKKDSPPPPATAQGGNAATVDGQPISLAQLDARVAKQLYDARQQALGDMVNEALLEKEAKSQGITIEALTQKEVKTGSSLNVGISIGTSVTPPERSGCFGSIDAIERISCSGLCVSDGSSCGPQSG
ncbi:MAG: SurA N-terminal domain-containing protein, partial [Acidobacteria bacterium]|nr:SurA N-terminal domain-containing protein [Acidobacteriota bacterium]